MILLLLLIISISIFLSTFGFSLLSIVFYKIDKKYQSLDKDAEVLGDNNQKPKIHFLIPVHNEESTIIPTVSSIREILSIAGGKILIRVDAPNDNTLRVLNAHGIDFKSNLKNLGKWQTLESLMSDLRCPNEDWVGFIDSGTLVNQNTLTAVKCSISERISCLSPSYQKSRANIISKLYWLFEASLKHIENYSGGPISVHGAAVFYRYSDVKRVFRYVHLWKLLSPNKTIFQHLTTNDDVVIPLILSRLGKRTRYLFEHSISDIGANNNIFRSSKRKLMGNLWMKFPKLYTSSPTLACKALRRITRILIPNFLIALLYILGYLFLPKSIVITITVLPFLLPQLKSKIFSFVKLYLVLPIYFLCAKHSTLTNNKIIW